jgi:predicted metal-dependent phosphoesterase TrpH
MAASYYAAKAEGDRIGLSVFFAYEAGFFGLPHHGVEFLIYGLTPDWLKQHPELKNMDAEAHLNLVRSAGAMAVHAHPYREASYIPQAYLFPDNVDAVEVINANHSNSRRLSNHNPSYDEMAISYAREHKLPMVAGSDMHTDLLLGGGVAFGKKLESEADYCRAVLRGENYLLTNGEQVFDHLGNLLEGMADWA